ncbi:response regulator [Falsiroseomonas sp.]|uniref:response regulator n=1 Tax=Falsiroseomonas sp. TaxID=2870721 RepID=UPI003566366A
MPDVEPPPAAGPGILVVDDERQIVDLLTRYLAQHGVRSSGAYAAEEALRIVAADPAICVVLTDVRMPGQSGLLLAEELLRGRPEAQALEVVLITGAVAGEPGVEAFGRRAFDVLSKPFRPSEVASVVARALAASEERRRRARLAAPLQATAPAATESGRPPGALRPSQLPEATLGALRAPLLPILAAAETLATAPRLDAAEARMQAERIRDGALQLLALIEAAGCEPDPASAQSAA